MPSRPKKLTVDLTTNVGSGHTRVYVQAFHSAPVPALLFDGSRVVAANEAAEELMNRSEVSASFLRELLAHISRNPSQAEPGTIDGKTMRFRVFLPPPSDLDTHLRICHLVPTCRETPADVYARRGLTPPEKRVAALLLSGLTNRAIAANLGRSVETIRKHVSKVFRKCEVHSRSAYVALALGGSPYADCRRSLPVHGQTTV